MFVVFASIVVVMCIVCIVCMWQQNRNAATVPEWDLNSFFLLLVSIFSANCEHKPNQIYIHMSTFVATNIAFRALSCRSHPIQNPCAPKIYIEIYWFRKVSHSAFTRPCLCIFKINMVLDFLRFWPYKFRDNIHYGLNKEWMKKKSTHEKRWRRLPVYLNVHTYTYSYVHMRYMLRLVYVHL